MKAMIFAAGVGSRLKPWTDSHPKALAPVQGNPVINHVINQIRRTTGINDFVVNVHHFAKELEDWLKNKREEDNINVDISDEQDTLLETGGGLLKAKKFFEDEDCVLVHNADILTDINLQRVIDKHNQEKNDVTLLCRDRDSSRKLIFNKDGRLKGWKNYKNGEILPDGLQHAKGDKELAFNGIHVIGSKMIEALREYAEKTGESRFSLIPFYLDNIKNLKISCFNPNDNYRWIDIGKSETLQEANKLFKDHE
ncbi:MAG: NTP transferase domain-containing protein [Muribaculaceae bacterium]|nr:NTP transferase domain-containing protein [Muribaculaceae bacterium]